MNSGTPFDLLFKQLANIPTDVTIFWNLIGVMFLIGFLVYALYALVIIRQVFMMSSTFKTTAGVILKIFSFVHFFFAIGMLFLAYTVLF